MKFTPMAPVSTRTWPGPGEGEGASVYCRMSAGPASGAWVTYMVPTYAAVAAGFSPRVSAGGPYPVARQPLQPGGGPLVHRFAVVGGQSDAVRAVGVDVQFDRHACAAPCGGGVQRILHR